MNNLKNKERIYGMDSYIDQCKWTKEANIMCRILVDEIGKLKTWDELLRITDAIFYIRLEEKKMINEFVNDNNKTMKEAQGYGIGCRREEH